MFYSRSTFGACLLLYEVFQNSIKKFETSWDFYMKAGLYPSKLATSWTYSATFYHIFFPPDNQFLDQGATNVPYTFSIPLETGRLVPFRKLGEYMRQG